MRQLFCSALALALCLGVAVAKEKKKAEEKKVEAKVKAKNTSVHGAFKKFDAASSTLTLVVKVKKEVSDKAIKLADTTRVVIFEGETKKEGKAGLSAVKEGTPVNAGIDPEGKVVNVRIGTPPKKPKAK